MLNFLVAIAAFASTVSSITDALLVASMHAVHLGWVVWSIVVVSLPEVAASAPRVTCSCPSPRTSFERADRRAGGRAFVLGCAEPV